MAKKIRDIDRVRQALRLYDRAYLLAPEHRKPAVDARRSVLRADLHDRTIGLTDEGEYTWGLALASRI